MAVFLILVVSFVVFIKDAINAERIPPGPTPSEDCQGVVAFMSGYAWSENIGWISFRGPGYGVDVDYYGSGPPCSTNYFGYAWSENIGWITFNAEELVGCPYGTCDFWRGGLPDDPVRPLMGWARACYVFQSGCSGPLAPGRGEADGWIRFDGTNYGVNYHSGTYEFDGYAWSSDFGWISFNCANEGVCDTSTYYVVGGGSGNFDSNLEPICDSLTAVPSSGANPLSVSLTGEAHDQDATGTIVQYKFYTEGNCSTSLPSCASYSSDQEACEACGCTWTCDFLLCFCATPAVRDFSCTSDLDQAACETCCYWDQTVVTSTENAIEYTYDSPGNYCAKLSVQDNEGAWSDAPGDCADVCTADIAVGGGGAGNVAPEINDFTADPVLGSAPLTVSFHAGASDAEGAITEFLFNFGDNSFATVTASGVYSGTCSGPASCYNPFDPKTQEECNACPCRWDVTRKRCSSCEAPPFACAYYCEDIHDQEHCERCCSSWTPDPNPSSYEASVQHDYGEVGVFCAKVRAKDEQGAWSDIPGDCPAAAARQITVVAGTGGNQPPVCSSLTPDPSSGDFPLQVTFTGAGSDLDGAIAAYEFDFGNGDSTTVTGRCVGGSAGCGFEMGQEECNACGCSWNPIDHNCLTMLWPDPTCSDIDNQSDCETCSRCTWETDFASVDYTYPVAGSYCAKLRVQDDAGDWSDVPGACPDTCAANITVTEGEGEGENQPPSSLSLTPDPSSGDFPLQVTFTGAGSDLDGAIAAYEFDLDNGEIPTVTTSDTISYTYEEAGSYCAKLRVQDDAGDWSDVPGACPDTCAESVTVTEPAAPNSPPSAGISCCLGDCYQSPGACVEYFGNPLCLRNDATDPDGEADIVYSGWNIYGWGSNPDQDCTGKCNYTPQAIGPGDYTVSLHVEDSGGLGSTTTEDFSVLQDAVADFQCSYTVLGPWLPCLGFGALEGKIIYFKDNSTVSETGTNIVRRDWYFEDGTPASDEGGNATFTSSYFTPIDSYSGNVTLEVEDDVGRVDSTTYGVAVKKRFPQWWNVSP